ncbi:nuclear transport factor 2 family protein [Paenibacillus favisporus]|uniref:nuclear transport factor 2 family protein n=1 Tax=Paenibacillus favisporus TaxID=221028 RepID=UPI002DC0462C|nr:nuclear transport factor 2 family protein [Paenibacillus favisporus]MEC0174991.1 nuclear transport factor 2 family protein [Paenibacillus favisporus]
MSTISYAQAETIMQLFTDRIKNKDYEGFLDLFDEDVIFEFPYAPEALTQLLNGKRALKEYLETLDTLLEIRSFTEPLIHVSAESRVFIAQYKGSGTVLADGKPYEQKYISVVEVKNGKIVRFQDYWNPLAL